MKPLDPTGLKRLHRTWRRRTQGRLGLLVDGVQGPYNVGAILRTAAALGVDHVWFGGQTAPPEGDKTGKTALGAQRYLTWTVCDQALDAVALAKAAGYRVLAVELTDEAVAIHEADLRGDVCLVVGNEDHGVRKDVLVEVDGAVFIAQTGKIGSLNVATAASIALYEARRQGWGPTSHS